MLNADHRFGNFVRRAIVDTPYGQRCFCPVGYMLYIDGKDPRCEHTQPSPHDVAYLMTGYVVGKFAVYLAGDHEQQNMAIEYNSWLVQTNQFTRPWDRNELPTEQLAVALGLVPPSADETHGDEA